MQLVYLPHMGGYLIVQDFASRALLPLQSFPARKAFPGPLCHSTEMPGEAPFQNASQNAP